MAKVPVLARRIAPESRIVQLRISGGPMMVNAYLVESGEERILVDTGVGKAPEAVLAAIREACGGDPTAIVLTHGHSDHAGSVAFLAEATGARVYAHPAEIPFLTGQRAYGELNQSFFYIQSKRPKAWVTGPVQPLQDGERVGPLVAVHTPGHTPGHLVLWLEEERTALSGDILRESGGKVNTAPGLFTADVKQNRESIRRLAAAIPEVERLCPAHGEPILQGAGEGIRRFLGQ
ncbi:MAG: MBL fold metallo-hydrolase [Mycobacterium leprae]